MAIERILVVLPNWVGDVVLASPVLAALRRRFARARVTFLLRAGLRDVVAGGGWHDAELRWPPRRLGASRRLVGAIRRERFDVALLLTNSFRSAMIAWLAGVPRRVGYARDWRSWLLTDRLRPMRRAGAFVPVPMTAYYANIAERIDCPVTDLRLRLGVTAEDEAAAARLRAHHRLAPGEPYAVVNPGAAFGSAKCWPPERFAEACALLRERHGLRSVIVGSPGEAPLMRAIAAAARGAAVCCLEPGTTLGSLKPLIRDAALLLCNDTGPRHYGIAFGTPTVTIFGPTDPAWTATDSACEVRLREPVECGPCHLRECPLDHACMTRITSAAVLDAAERLLGRRDELVMT